MTSAWQRLTMFEKCLAVSFFLHSFLFLGGHLWRPGSGGIPLPFEVDLTRPLLPGGAAKLGAPKRRAEAPAPGPSLPAEPDQQPRAEAAKPAQDWVAPGPETKTLEKPAPPPPTAGGTAEGSGAASKPGGWGEGANEGVPGGTGVGGSPLTKLPRLLNRDEVLANLRRFYPEMERRAGREGAVTLNLHIGADGKVASVEVAQSAGAAFDNAAKAVAFLMVFSPAEMAIGPVSVKISQPMVFRLED